MNRIVLLCVVAGMLGFSLNTALAADAQTLSLKQAETIAVQQHPRITAAELEALASRETVREARSAFFPTITANATAVGTTAENTRIAAGALNNPLILERNAEGINLSQLITDFGRTAGLTASSRLHARAEEEKTLATRAEILLLLDAAYFEALQAQSVLEVAKQTVATRQLIFDQVSERATNGLRSGLDVSFARVSLEEGRLLQANARNDVRAAFTRLANLLGARGQADYKLVEEPLPAGPAPEDTQLVQMALRDRPDVVRLRFERDAAEKFANAEQDLHYPTISAVGSAGVMPLHDEQLKANYAAAGVNLSLPIFDGLLFSARQKEARLRAQAAAETLRDAENNVVRDVRISALDLNYAAERVGLTAKLLESANEAFDLAQARYQVGSSSMVELSQAQLSQTEAELAQAKAKYELQLRNAVLNYQTGKMR